MREKAQQKKPEERVEESADSYAQETIKESRPREKSQFWGSFGQKEGKPYKIECLHGPIHPNKKTIENTHHPGTTRGAENVNRNGEEISPGIMEPERSQGYRKQAPQKKNKNNKNDSGWAG